MKIKDRVIRLAHKQYCFSSVYKGYYFVLGMEYEVDVLLRIATSGCFAT